MSVRFEAPPLRQEASRDRSSRPASKPPINIQDSFLFGSLKEGTPLVVALLTGKLIQGRIVRFDRYAIVIDDGTNESLIYKHSVACIARAAA